MAPKRTYFVRLLSNTSLHDYVPLVRDPTHAYRMSAATLDPLCGTLDDSEVLDGAIITEWNPQNPRQATVGDLRAGRARDIYWAIEGLDGEEAHWRTRTDVRWRGGQGHRVSGDTFTFKSVIHAETYGGLVRPLDQIPMVEVHARRFRETLNGLSPGEPKKRKQQASPSEPKTDSEPAKQASPSEPKKRKQQAKPKKAKVEPAKQQIDLVRTDDPVDWDLTRSIVRSVMAADSTSNKVEVSLALYVLLDHTVSPTDLLHQSTAQTYWVPSESLRFASYTKIKERIEAIEQQQEQQSISQSNSQGSVCS